MTQLWRLRERLVADLDLVLQLQMPLMEHAPIGSRAKWSCAFRKEINSAICANSIRSWAGLFFLPSAMLGRQPKKIKIDGLNPRSTDEKAIQQRLSEKL